jgi:multidrug efflux pump subunit AcrA (membrane-fusion protein)
MNRQLFKFLALITSIAIFSACGKGPDQEPLPRLVKVVVLGQAGEVAQELGTIKDPGVLRFDASGKVMEVLVKSGDTVFAGQSLARIIPNSVSSESTVMISYRATKAELQSAEADFKRYTDLKNKNFISASEFDRRVATIESARAKYEQAIESIGFVTMRALESGKVTQMSITVGQMVSNQDVVGKIITDKTSKKLEKNTSNTNGNNNNNSRTTSKAALKIPTTAIHSDGVSVFKLTLDKGSQSTGKISAVKLVLGKIDDQSAELISGLAAGDIVIATGWHALSEGQQVRIAIAEKAQ